jgi:hypothetical protein
MRAMWSGAVSFGLVSVPVKLYSATENHDIRFHQVHGADGGRIRYKRVCEVCGNEVEYADIVKGYETDDGELITLDEADLESLPVASGNREIDVMEFVPSPTRSTRCCWTRATTWSRMPRRPSHTRCCARRCARPTGWRWSRWQSGPGRRWRCCVCGTR